MRPCQVVVGTRTVDEKGNPWPGLTGGIETPVFCGAEAAYVYGFNPAKAARPSLVCPEHAKLFLPMDLTELGPDAEELARQGERRRRREAFEESNRRARELYDAQVARSRELRAAPKPKPKPIAPVTTRRRITLTGDE